MFAKLGNETFTQDILSVFKRLSRFSCRETDGLTEAWAPNIRPAEIGLCSLVVTAADNEDLN